MTVPHGAAGARPWLRRIADGPRVGISMIARTWRGWTRREDSDAYLDYIERTGGRASRETPGNSGFYLRREDGDRIEFVTISLWDSLDAIRAFQAATSTRPCSTTSTIAFSSIANASSRTTRS